MNYDCFQTCIRLFFFNAYLWIHRIGAFAIMWVKD